MEEYKMSNQLFSLKTELYVGLTTKQGNNIFRDRAIKDITYLLDKRGIDSFSVIDTTGYWKGKEEKGLIVTLIHDSDGVVDNDLANDIRKSLEQESVLAVCTKVRGGLIYD